MQKELRILLLLATLSLLPELFSEKLTDMQKASYQNDFRYHDILENPQKFSDKKFTLKVCFTETQKNNIKSIKDLLPEGYELFKFEGFAEELPVVFSNKDGYIKGLIDNLQKNTLVILYCDLSYKFNKDKEKKNTTPDKKYYIKIEDIDIEPNVVLSEKLQIDEKDFKFITPIRLDIQYVNMDGQKIKLYLHFSDIGQQLHQNIQKFTQKNSAEYFCLIPKEKIFLPIICSRNDEKIVSTLETLNPGEIIAVYAIVRKAENPATKNDNAIYYLDLVKVTKENE
ncbi:MAG TPA: hypothetical protein P5270_06805 [Victivallales bacterium]|nr:hypothetical protein [Victivallales bacterium]HPO90798.1 hypothetical protein [Victivallales bacterium]HRR29056.1 hypothetical protein [Victivallales bacterium]HRU00486.1 hypothetical protein [Victivallales bacterium]